MTRCPVCHVMNEDMSRFCAECGQRLSTPGPAALAKDLSSSAQMEPPSPDTGKTHLHSPLLEGDTVPEPPPRPVGRKRLRSPLLPDAGADQGPALDTGGRLHSPLLEGDESNIGQMPVRRSSRGKQRSPIFSNTEDGAVFPEEDLLAADDTHVLRSPLLGAKVPLHQKSSAAGTDRADAPGIRRANKPASANEPQASAPLPNKPAAAAPLPLPAEAAVSLPPVPEAGTLPFQPEASASWRPPLEAKQPDRQAQWSTPPVVPAGNAVQTGARLPAASSETSNLPPASSQNVPGHALPGFVKMLVLPLALAAIMKVWVTFEFVKNQPFFPVVADQIGQLVVCLSLLLICLTARRH